MLHATAVYGVVGGDEFCGVDTVRALLERHPGLVLVVAHIGMPEFDAAIGLAEAADDVHLDLSMTLHEGPVSAHVPDGALARLQLSDDALRGVLAGNAAALLARRVPPSSG